MEPSDELIKLWLWEYTDEFGKRTRSTWRMTEETVRQFAHTYRDAVKVDGSLERRRPLGVTSDFLKRP